MCVCVCGGGGGFTVVDNTGPGCGVRGAGVRGAGVYGKHGVTGSVENTRSRGLLGFAKNTDCRLR